MKPGTLAKRILQKHIGTVTKVVQTCLVDFSGKLLEEAVIAEGLYNPDDRMMTNAQYAMAMYRACMTTVEVDPSKFSTVVEILSEYPLLEKTVQEMTTEGIKAGLIEEKSHTMAQSKEGALSSQRDLVKSTEVVPGFDTPPETMLTDKQLAKVKEELGDFSQWKMLGEKLGLSPGSLERIQADYSGTDERLGQTLLKWLRRTHNERDYGPPTWSNLVKALNPINSSLAEEIHKKRCTHQVQGRVKEPSYPVQPAINAPVKDFPDTDLEETDSLLQVVKGDQPKTIFISYGREEEVNGFVDQLLREIEAAGWPTFMDRRDIRPGDEWMEKLSTALNHCRAIVAVITPKYLNSKYCKLELIDGYTEGKVIFPIALGSTMPAYESAKHGQTIKMIISKYQFTMFKSARFEKATMKSLLEGINANLSPATPSEPDIRPTQLPPAKNVASQRIRRFHYLCYLGIVSIVILVIAVVIGWLIA